MVEDNTGDRMAMRRAFSKYPVEIEEARDGAEALVRLRAPFKAVPDLVILDLNIPRISGWEVLAEMKADPALRKIPVIVMSSSQAKQDIERAYDLFCSSYIVKPMEGGVGSIAVALYTYWLATTTVPTRIPPL